MINKYNPLHQNESRRILYFNPKLVDIQMITKLGLVMNDRLEIMTNIPLRPDTPFTLQAFKNCSIHKGELKKLKNEDFFIESETPEQTDIRYLFHIFQIEERKKIIVKERNKLKKEASKISLINSQASSPKIQQIEQQDFRNYYSNRTQDQINTFNNKSQKEMQKIKAEFVMTLERELHNNQIRNQNDNSTTRAFNLKDKSDYEKMTRAQNQNNHASEIGHRKRQNEERIHIKMEAIKQDQISVSYQKNILLLEKQKVENELQMVKDDKESLRYSQVISRKKHNEQDILSNGEILLKNLNKKIEHSSYLNGQYAFEKSKRLDKMLSKIEIVLGKAQERENEEIYKKMSLAVEKGSGSSRKLTQPSLNLERELKKTEKIKKNLVSLKQLDQVTIQKIEDRIQAKDLCSDRIIIENHNKIQERQISQRDRQQGILKRYEKINQDHMHKCDQILEKERYDFNQFLSKTSKRDLFREQMIAQSKLDCRRQRDNLSTDLARFSEKPTKGLLIKSLQKYDLHDNQLVERFYPTQVTDKDE